MLKGAVCRFNVGNPDLLAFWKNAEELALFEKRREENACWFKGRMEDFYTRRIILASL